MKRTIVGVAAAVLASATLIAPTFALTITARVSGGNIAVYDQPREGARIVARLMDGQEIPVDECTQNDSDSYWGSFGDAGHRLRGKFARQYCHIPELGWVDRSWIVGKGLVNVTPPDFHGAGW
ncbi:MULTISPECIES: hypothetical protein [unclassified Devosia]|uniref:hypothetical protein n=1 Tax=unclassified Devosia TaxID=196773 RepID=UPI00145DEAAB|nr:MULTISPECIES: hypothetical protein [unclassified Devosia]MBJ6987461.1 hypothetical protein [Devosia sp. MC521]MBK1793923.1 hypothetical protein [Devosia sp. WQ 349K1]QMW61824.1 hypothetical protein H4N61_12735 [Devosia sp. MC521]